MSKSKRSKTLDTQPQRQEKSSRERVAIPSKKDESIIAGNKKRHKMERHRQDADPVKTVGDGRGKAREVLVIEKEIPASEWG